VPGWAGGGCAGPYEPCSGTGGGCPGRRKRDCSGQNAGAALSCAHAGCWATWSALTTGLAKVQVASTGGVGALPVSSEAAAETGGSPGRRWPEGSPVPDTSAGGGEPVGGAVPDAGADKPSNRPGRWLGVHPDAAGGTGGDGRPTLAAAAAGRADGAPGGIASGGSGRPGGADDGAESPGQPIRAGRPVAAGWLAPGGGGTGRPGADGSDRAAGTDGWAGYGALGGCTGADGSGGADGAPAGCRDCALACSTRSSRCSGSRSGSTVLTGSGSGPLVTTVPWIISRSASASSSAPSSGPVATP
jgi:hypothetical protein